MDTDVTIQTAEFDGRGRRITKVTTNSGDSDKTVVYLWDGEEFGGVRGTQYLSLGSSGDAMGVRGTQYLSLGCSGDIILISCRGKLVRPEIRIMSPVLGVSRSARAPG